MDSERLATAQQRVRPVKVVPPRSVPTVPYVDSQTGEWVISRFLDVQSAFLEPGLCPVGRNAKRALTAKDRDDQAQARAAAQEALTVEKILQWGSGFASQALEIVSDLPINRAVDVIGEFARPWALTVAVKVTGAKKEDAAHLAELAAKVSASTADPDNLSLKANADQADEELGLLFKDGALPMAGPAFVGLSQTLPHLLANVWHALMQNSQQFNRLHDASELIPRALEELLRMAGLVNELHRQAINDLDINGTRVKAGERLRLEVRAAHRDCEQFTSPDEFDMARRNIRHFAFGAGAHSCAAAPLLRMLMAIATRCLVAHFILSESPTPVMWYGGKVFRWPAPLCAVRRKI